MLQTIKTCFLISICFSFISCSSKKENIILLNKTNNKNINVQKIDNYSLNDDSEFSQDTENSISGNHNILLLLPLRGAHKEIGNEILNSCILAAKNNPVKDVEIHVIDTANENIDKNLLYKKFKGKNLLAIVGPLFYREAKQYGALFPETPIFTFSNNKDVNNNHIFSCGLSPRDELTKLFSNDVDNLFILLPDGVYGDNLIQEINHVVKNKKLRENMEIVRYENINSIDAFECLANSDKKNVFVVEPIFDKKVLDGYKVLTLSQNAMMNPEKWKGCTFAFGDNVKFLNFISFYKSLFDRTPSYISAVGYDLIDMICSSIVHNEESSDSIVFLNRMYNGSVGTYKIKKNKGLLRSLKKFTM